MKSNIFRKKIPYFNLISRIAKENRINIWLVGGFLRDIFIKKERELIDFDFCVEKNVLKIVKEFSREIGSKYIILDESEGSYRVILKKKSKIYTYDFTLMRGESFTQDISLRDFTINMLAVSLLDKDSKVLDNFNSIIDLRKKIISTVREETLVQDPLRILRGFSFMVNYNFRIDGKTQRWMIKYRKLLKNVSAERINEELFKIFSSKHSFDAIKRMDEFKILKEVIPEITKTKGVYQGGFHHLDVWAHSLETLREFEVFYRNYLSNKKDILEYLNERLAENRTRMQILKLACLLHDIGKPAAKSKKGKRTIFHTHEKIGRDKAEIIAQRLKLSFCEKEVLKKLIFWHLRPGYLADQETPTKRAIYHFFRDTGEEGVGVILLSFSDWRATRGPLIDFKKRKKHERIMLKLVDDYFEEKKKKPLPKLVDGYDIMKKFKLSPSALIGKILKSIKEEQALGKIKTKAEAYSVAKRIALSERN